MKKGKNVTIDLSLEFGVREIVFIILMTVLCCFLWYLFIPAITVHSVGFWILILLCAILFITISSMDFFDSDFNHLLGLLGIIVGIMTIVILLIGWVSSWKTFHVEGYRSLVEVSKGNSFNEDFPEVLPDGSNIPYVDLGTARKLGDRSIGKINHSSWYDVDDEYNLIKYQDEYYRLSPLKYGSIFTYRKGKNDGIPGYVLVNVTTQTSTFVPVEDGFFYSPSACWSKNLTRHLRKQYPHYIFGNEYFEIDESGYPYWITSVRESTVGLFGGLKEEKFVLTDAVTGKSEVYAKSDLPEWIDHAVGLKYAMSTLEKYYGLINGAWNFSKTDVYKTSFFYKNLEFSGYNSFVDSNGDVCFYTGLTPANNAESNTGFLLINCRTGNTREYLYEDSNGGIEEGTAIERAESEVQNYGYTSTFPLLVNIASEPTYLMCLKGNDGLVKQIALAMVSNKSSTIVTADTLEEAIKKYKTALTEENVIDNVEETTSDIEETTGVISDKFEITVDGTTHYLYQLNDGTILYDASIKTGYEQAAYVAGDTVKIKYYEGNDDLKTVIEIIKTK